MSRLHRDGVNVHPRFAARNRATITARLPTITPSEIFVLIFHAVWRAGLVTGQPGGPGLAAQYFAVFAVAILQFVSHRSLSDRHFEQIGGAPDHVRGDGRSERNEERSDHYFGHSQAT